MTCHIAPLPCCLAMLLCCCTAHVTALLQCCTTAVLHCCNTEVGTATQLHGCFSMPRAAVLQCCTHHCTWLHTLLHRSQCCIERGAAAAAAAAAALPLQCSALLHLPLLQCGLQQHAYTAATMLAHASLDWTRTTHQVVLDICTRHCVQASYLCAALVPMLEHGGRHLVTSQVCSRTQLGRRGALQWRRQHSHAWWLPVYGCLYCGSTVLDAGVCRTLLCASCMRKRERAQWQPAHDAAVHLAWL